MLLSTEVGKSRGVCGTREMMERRELILQLVTEVPEKVREGGENLLKGASGG